MQHTKRQVWNIKILIMSESREQGMGSSLVSLDPSKRGTWKGLPARTGLMEPWKKRKQQEGTRSWDREEGSLSEEKMPRRKEQSAPSHDVT